MQNESRLGTVEVKTAGEGHARTRERKQKGREQEAKGKRIRGSEWVLVMFTEKNMLNPPRGFLKWGIITHTLKLGAYDHCWIEAHFQIMLQLFPLSLSERKSQSPSTIISFRDWYHSFLSFCWAPVETIHHVRMTLAHLWPRMWSHLWHKRLLAAFITGKDSDLLTTCRVKASAHKKSGIFFL